MKSLALSLLLVGSALFPAAALGSSATILYQQSYELESAGMYAASLERVEQLATLGEDDYLFHLRRGWLLYLNARYVDALEAYGVATQRAPKSVEALLGQTLPLMALRRWSETEQVCSEILTRAPGNYLGGSRRAFALFSSGRFAEAQEAYRAVLEHYPSDTDMQSGLGWTLLRLGQTEQARAAFEAVLRTTPGHVSAGQGLAELR